MQASGEILEPVIFWTPEAEIGNQMTEIFRLTSNLPSPLTTPFLAETLRATYQVLYYVFADDLHPISSKLCQNDTETPREGLLNKVSKLVLFIKVHISNKGELSNEDQANLQWFVKYRKLLKEIVEILETLITISIEVLKRYETNLANTKIHGFDRYFRLDTKHHSDEHSGWCYSFN